MYRDPEENVLYGVVKLEIYIKKRGERVMLLKFSLFNTGLL